MAKDMRAFGVKLVGCESKDGRKVIYLAPEAEKAMRVCCYKYGVKPGKLIVTVCQSAYEKDPTINLSNYFREYLFRELLETSPYTELYEDELAAKLEKANTEEV